MPAEVSASATSTALAAAVVVSAVVLCVAVHRVTAPPHPRSGEPHDAAAAASIRYHAHALGSCAAWWAWVVLMDSRTAWWQVVTTALAACLMYQLAGLAVAFLASPRTLATVAQQLVGEQSRDDTAPRQCLGSRMAALERVALPTASGPPDAASRVLVLRLQLQQWSLPTTVPRVRAVLGNMHVALQQAARKVLWCQQAATVYIAVDELVLVYPPVMSSLKKRGRGPGRRDWRGDALTLASRAASMAAWGFHSGLQTAKATQPATDFALLQHAWFQAKVAWLPRVQHSPQPSYEVVNYLRWRQIRAQALVRQHWGHTPAAGPLPAPIHALALGLLLKPGGEDGSGPFPCPPLECGPAMVRWLLQRNQRVAPPAAEAVVE